VLTREGPHLTLVQGDSTTALTAALAAYYHRVPVGHVEAGLRTSDKYRPFPEEINRRLTTSLADFHFAPTDAARENLLREGIREETVAVTGNTVIDALVNIRTRLSEDPGLAHDPIGSGETRRIIVVTAHRRESFGEQFRHMCEAIRAVAERRPDVLIVYPVHLNPNVQGPVHEILQRVCNVRLIPPMDYASFVALMVRAHILLTDSGGLQEEGPALGKPVLVMREISERPEGVAAGASVLVGTTPDRIVGAVLSLLDDPERYRAMASGTPPYGDGRASERIVQFLKDRCLP
jgi:UDP-N-acetylglucosamine 2-epimerase